MPPSTCLVPISLGELFDKYTILQIKQQRVVDPVKLTHVGVELAHLQKLVDTYSSDLVAPLITKLIAKLILVNSELWDIEDRIRQKEAAGEFDAEFIQLARRVYLTNDKRFSIKNRINETLGSDIKEIKSYCHV